MFFWRQVVSQTPEEGLKPTATPGYSRNFRDLNEKVSQGKSFSGYERNPFFLNREGVGFSEIGGLLGVNYDDDSRAVATVDWDRDGDLDVWVTNRNAPQVRLLKNNFPNDRDFVMVRLIGNGESTNKDAVGARLTLSSPAGAKPQMRTIRAGNGFLAQSSAWSHFGVSRIPDQSYSLKVAWPGGGVETFDGLHAGERYVVTQGQGKLSDPVSVQSVELVAQEESEIARPKRSGFWVANQVPFPHLSYKDEESVTRSTGDLAGAPLLVSLWATWCLPCLEELAMIGEHADELQAMGATVLALNVDGLAVDGSAEGAGATAKDVLARAGYDLPYGFGQQENLAMIELVIEQLTTRKDTLSIPASFLVDAEGNVAAVYREALSWEQLSSDLALLNATPDAKLDRASPRPGRWFADPRQLDREALLSGYATLFAANGFPEEAQRLYAIAKPGGSDLSPQEYYNQAKSASQQGDQKKAMEYYRAAIKLDPEYGQALTGLGAMLLMQKKIDEAQPLFERALELDPGHATALINMAMIDQARGNEDSALKRLQQVIERNPNYAEAHLNLGSLLASMKRHEEAIEHLSKAISLNPQREVAHLNLAAAYVKTRQWAKAEERYLVVLSINPRISFAALGLGVVQARQNRHEEAVGSFQRALAVGGASPKVFTQMGLSLLALGNRASAEEAFNRALALDPDYRDAKNAIGTMSQKKAE